MIARRLVNTRSVIQQQPHHRGIAVSNREQQRRHSAVWRRQGALPDDPVSGRRGGSGRHVLSRRDRDVGMSIDVGAARQKQFHYVGVIFEHRPHERGLPMHVVLGVDLRSPIEQQCDRIHLAGAGRGHESGFAARIGAVRIHAGVQQLTDHGRAAVGGREGDGRDAVAVGGLHIRAGFDQRVNRLEIVVANRPMQSVWCRPGRLLRRFGRG